MIKLANCVNILCLYLLINYLPSMIREAWESQVSCLLLRFLIAHAAHRGIEFRTSTPENKFNCVAVVLAVCGEISGRLCSTVMVLGRARRRSWRIGCAQKIILIAPPQKTSFSLQKNIDKYSVCLNLWGCGFSRGRCCAELLFSLFRGFAVAGAAQT